MQCTLTYPFGHDELHALGDAVDVLGQVLGRQLLHRAVAVDALGIIDELKYEALIGASILMV